MIEKPWRQCVHACGQWYGSASDEFLPVGPFREGGRIVEVRVTLNMSSAGTIPWMPFLCGSGSLTIENCRAGTPVVGYSNYRLYGLPLISFRYLDYMPGAVVLPCAIRVVGGAQWVVVYIRRFSTPMVYALCSVTIEGVDWGE